MVAVNLRILEHVILTLVLVRVWAHLRHQIQCTRVELHFRIRLHLLLDILVKFTA